ncbi:MAG TPA: SDR family oxidoreductase [Polyangiales bacterium]|nr:SDR family oxidoreductase [Polyangiales bacterium]
MLLRDKVCIVSGVGPGLGRALALELAGQGAQLALLGRNPEHAAEVARELSPERPPLCVRADVTDLPSCQAALESILARFGRVDVLVNNAFATGPAEPIQADRVMKAWRPAFKVNVFGTLQLSQLVAAQMKPGGSIVMVNSMAARKPQLGLAAYGAAKAALLAASQSLASELGPRGVRVNSIVPGYIDGPGLAVYVQMEAAKQACDERTARERIAGLSALSRIATPREVAQAALFFASELSSAVTGQTLDVNCGEWFG